MHPIVAMNRRFIRRLALALIAFLAFAQASVALAACTMERGTMAQMATLDDACCGVPEVKPTALTSGCVVHCTADLQLSGLSLDLARVPAAVPVFVVQDRAFGPAPPATPEAPRTIPPRILLHSFQI